MGGSPLGGMDMGGSPLGGMDMGGAPLGGNSNEGMENLNGPEMAASGVNEGNLGMAAPIGDQVSSGKILQGKEILPGRRLSSKECESLVCSLNKKRRNLKIRK